MLVSHETTVCLVGILIIHGETSVCDIVSWWHGMILRCGGYNIWLKFAFWYDVFQHIIYIEYLCKCRIRRMKAIYNETIYRSLEQSQIRVTL